MMQGPGKNDILQFEAIDAGSLISKRPHVGAMEIEVTAPVAPAPEMVTLPKEEWTAQIRSAEAKGAESGKQAAQRAAAEAEERLRNTYEAGLAVVMEKISAQLASLDRQQQEFLKQCQEDMLRLSVSIARKITGRETDRHAISRVEQAVEECLGQLFGESEATVLVHENLVEPLRERGARMVQQSGFSGTLRIETGPELDLGDCRVEWKNGAAEYRAEALWKDIEQIINRLGGQKAAQEQTSAALPPRESQDTQTATDQES